MGSPSSMKVDDKLLRKRLNARLRQQRCRARKRASQKRHQDMPMTPNNAPSRTRRVSDSEVSPKSSQIEQRKSFNRRYDISASMLQDTSRCSAIVVPDEKTPSPVPLSSDNYHLSSSGICHSSKSVSPMYEYEDELRHTAIDAMLSLRNVFYNRGPSMEPSWKGVVWTQRKCMAPKWSELGYHHAPYFDLRRWDQQHSSNYLPNISKERQMSNARYISPY